MTALSTVVVIAACFGALAWIVSLVTGDTSQIDRLWSIVPVIYVWVFVAFAHFHSVRLNVIAVLVLLWGARLTYNFWRKGGYRGVEDYRWAVVRSRMKPWVFQVFNLFSVIIYQSTLLVLITLPAMTAYHHQAVAFGGLDWLLTFGFLLCLALETVADQQQWNFHLWKHAEIAAGRTPDPQFLQTGLFRYSRHPNYFFEQAQWWIVFFFGAVAAGSLWQWTGVGAVLLTLLFVGSTRLTEQITLSKYPEYADYQRCTSAVVPWIVRRRPAAVEV